jgi:hypothetical protein
MTVYLRNQKTLRHGKGCQSRNAHVLTYALSHLNTISPQPLQTNTHHYRLHSTPTHPCPRIIGPQHPIRGKNIEIMSVGRRHRNNVTPALVLASIFFCSSGVKTCSHERMCHNACLVQTRVEYLRWNARFEETSCGALALVVLPCGKRDGYAFVPIATVWVRDELVRRV